MSALLSELAAMRAADPGAKAVVFSSWGRLLKLVGDALDQVGRGGRWAFFITAESLLLAVGWAQRCWAPCCASAARTEPGCGRNLVTWPPAQNGVRHATLAGANPAQREEALHSFLHDPDCVVLTVRAS